MQVNTHEQDHINGAGESVDWKAKHPRARTLVEAGAHVLGADQDKLGDALHRQVETPRDELFALGQHLGREPAAKQRIGVASIGIAAPVPA